MPENVAVVIPFYKESINDYELIALQQCEKILGSYPKIAVTPTNFNLPPKVSTVSFSNIKCFDESYFKNIAGYNRLMLSSEFYESFLAYEYILIYQMDCFVFKDELSYWCDQQFDYLGAPWIRKLYHKNKFELGLLKIQQYFSSLFSASDFGIPNQKQLYNRVGNGGLSLRKVKKFFELCVEMRSEIDSYMAHTGNLYNEDVFWSIEVNRTITRLNIPDCSIGLKFAFETPPFKPTALNESNMPFGCHDWDHFAEYWREEFNKLGYKI